MATIQIQRSIGCGSLGMMWSAVEPGQLPALLEQSGQQHGRTAEETHARLMQGATVWLDRATGEKLRGYDADADARAQEAREAARARRMAEDGYGQYY